MSRNLARLIPQISNMLDAPFRRAVAPFNSHRWPVSSFGSFDREFERMSNMIDRMHNDFWNNSNSLRENSQGNHRGKINQNLFNIVEEDGIKKMRIIFDAERCKPEDIEIKTKGNQLEIKARTEEKREHFSSIQEYSQFVTLPEGVRAEELTCQFEGGMVKLEAPYTPPAVEAPKDIPVQKEAAEPVMKNIPIKHE